MRLSPLNIKKQEFNKSFRGYDVEEVKTFLEKLANEYDEILKENESLKKQLEESTSQLSEFRKIEKSLQDTLLKAQDNASKSIESTRKQSALMLKEAEIKASQMIEKAKEQADEIRNAIIKLRDERDLIIAKLRAIINTQTQLLNSINDKIKHSNTVESQSLFKKNQIEDSNISSSKFNINVDEIINKIL
jgi:cell division initiation protein